ncbi:IPP transferase [Nesidiocoris tenuis]|uniref:IPP transferase n=1 Tax=Nesidiocoris tenuis TaxID=355587 RepID=A0ABN7BFY5_9HEMI|nr:IPP transferase [Nesidiocoris tenuis]
MTVVEECTPPDRQDSSGWLTFSHCGHKNKKDFFKSRRGSLVLRLKKANFLEESSVRGAGTGSKMSRAMQIHATKGQPQSEIITAQRSQKGGSSHGGPLRFKNAMMFWLRCNEEVLDKRLDDRVDDMMNRGLVQELLDFHNTYNEERLKNMDKSVAYTQGIFQSIGFKEFHPYLTLKAEERDTDSGKQLLEKGIEDLKLVTRRYARRQIKWIKNRFIRSKDREVPEIYGLDATDLDTWDENVLKPAIDIVGARLGLPDYKTSIKPLPKEDPIDNSLEENFCNVCQRVFTEKYQWEVHLKSNRHKRELAKKKRKENQQNEATKKVKATVEDADAST